MNKKNHKNEIKKIKAREILDSRGRSTVEVDLITGQGLFRASVPSGTSKGKYEAVEKEAKIAIKNINKIIEPKLTGKDPLLQKEIDELMIGLDGTKNKSKLGANAILAVSMAVLRAGAKANNLPLWKWISKIAKTKPKLPIPAILYIEGGLHGPSFRVAKAKVRNLDIQEVMAFSEEKTFGEKFRTAKKIYYNSSKILNKKYGDKGTKPGLEGAFVPPIKDIKEALNLLIKASGKKKIKIILDIAASSLRFKKSADYYLNLAKQYPIFGVEDPFGQDDLGEWKRLKEECKKKNVKLLIIGDDLTVTNPERIKMAYQRKLCNALIIKPNQIGTVSEAIEAVRLAKSYGWKIMVSHRSGETQDDFIADLAVGVGADFIKAGAPSRPERMAKYNRLLKIEKELKK